MGINTKSILFLLTILLFSCTTPSEKAVEEINKEINKENDSVQKQNALDLESIGLNPSDEAPIDLDSPAPRYWYVYYSARRKSDDAEWGGYKVIKMDESYFDIYKARKMLFPSCVDEDYVGIQFFKEVSEKTYVEYIKQ